MTDLPFALMCPQCRFVVEVSEEDPDATVSYAYEHILQQHADYDRARAEKLLAQLREVPF